MTSSNGTTPKTLVPGLHEQEWPGVDSRYRLIVVAALRSKQLLHGATPRIEPDPLRHRNTSIALEEVKRGLVSFSIIDEEHPDGIDADKSDDNDPEVSGVA